MTDGQYYRRGNVLEEIRLHGPGTVKQIAESLNEDEAVISKKLVGMTIDGELTIFQVSSRYSIFGLAKW